MCSCAVVVPLYCTTLLLYPSLHPRHQTKPSTSWFTSTELMPSPPWRGRRSLIAVGAQEDNRLPFLPAFSSFFPFSIRVLYIVPFFASLVNAYTYGLCFLPAAGSFAGVAPLSFVLLFRPHASTLPRCCEQCHSINGNPPKSGTSSLVSAKPS